MRFLVLPFFLFLFSANGFAGIFPVKGPIYDADKTKIAMAHSYPRYVEIMDGEGKFVAKAGILVSKGVGRIHVVLPSGTRSIVGFAKRGVMYDSQNKMRGTYFWTPTYSFVYDMNKKRVGSTKCIAWPRVCSVAVAAYLLGMLKEPVAADPNAKGGAALDPKFVAPVPFAAP